MSDKNFGYLGTTFQQQLLKILIEDKKFSITVIETIDSKYFDGPYFKYLMENIKELYKLYGAIPTYITLEQKIMLENKDVSSKVHIDTLHAIQELEMDDVSVKFVKKTSKNFCRQQVLRKAIKEVDDINANGEFEEYYRIEGIITDALQIGASDDSVIDIFENVRESLLDDNRVPYPTGITGLDSLLKGGLAKSELGIFLAPLGVGKTTFLTKVANTAYNVGANVLHIFFEDNERDIRRKHYTCWTKYSDTDQKDHLDEVVKIVEEKKTTINFLNLVKLPSWGVSVGDIKSIVRKLQSQGKHIDMLVVDYVDCISTERSIEGEEWKGEGTIMRSLEGMKDEFNIAIWTATQGNRDSLSSEVVTTDQMAGSIKKAQIGHIVISAGKTLEQKEHNLATVTLLKSRIGRDGVVFTNCKFNNEYLEIDTETQITLLGHEEEKAERKRERASEVYRAGRDKDKKTIEAEVDKILESRISTINKSHEVQETQEVIDEFGAIEIKDDDIIGDVIVQDTVQDTVQDDTGSQSILEISQEEKARQRLRELARQKKQKIGEMVIDTG